MEPRTTSLTFKAYRADTGSPVAWKEVLQRVWEGRSAPDEYVLSVTGGTATSNEQTPVLGDTSAVLNKQSLLKEPSDAATE